MAIIKFDNVWFINWGEKRKKTDIRIPDEYFLGEEYTDDKEGVPIIIECTFPLSAEIKEYEYNSKKFRASVFHLYSNLVLRIEREISHQLRNDIFTSDDPFLYFLGYIHQALFEFNNYLNTQRYLSGHLLIRTYSIFDIMNIEIIDKNTGEKTQIEWPRALPGFPPSIKLASIGDKRYIRDYIDAMNCYLYWDNDECIRKLISSLETYFFDYNIRRKKSFMNRLNDSLQHGKYLKNWQSYFYIWKSNIRFIYQLRNKIVHEGIKIKPQDRWIYKIGIGTLSYIYQNNIIEYNIREYIKSLANQFLLITFSIERSNLDELEFMKTRRGEGPILDTPEKFDEFNFRGLEIEESLQSQILESYSRS